MDPISGFVTAAVGDVAFNFGKGVVSAFLGARRKSRSYRAVALVTEAAPQPVLMSPDSHVVPVLDLVLIGRASDCDLILEHPDISRHHAELLRIDGVSFELRDLDSTNGTFVNGVRVGSRLVGDGDEIRLGSFPLNLYLE
ncbi:FHA domain-containing protein [Kribbella steppae]|uniref:FHA domain-containing protein n=1 Tax=Kribbella steppae TaxID=2512223 RepID=A0A4R2H8U3_9ACTN|nr:FHA domain-containing protein [Kribbella steppae]TCO23410.1 FHA domain-containing protein [Kribbella steppae]